MTLRVLSKKESLEHYNETFLSLKQETIFKIANIHVSRNRLSWTQSQSIYLVVEKITEKELVVIELSSKNNKKNMLTGQPMERVIYYYNPEDTINIVTESPSESSKESSSSGTSVASGTSENLVGCEPIDRYIELHLRDLQKEAEAWLATCKEERKTLIKKDSLWGGLIYYEEKGRIVESDIYFGKAKSLERKIKETVSSFDPPQLDGLKYKLFQVFGPGTSK